MIIDLSRVQLAVHSPAVVGAAVKIYQAGGVELTEDQLRRACGSAYLFKTHRDDIMGLVAEMDRSFDRVE